jgi:small neutral amino acid transporter SnatA (MarC family)
MMGAFVDFYLDIAVTTKTDLWFLGYLGTTGMQVMTRITGHIVSFVGTHLP